MFIYFVIMKNKQLCFIILCIVIFSSAFILLGCNGKNAGGAIGPVTPDMFLPITYEGKEIPDKYFDIQTLTCQQNAMYWDAVSGQPIINFSVLDSDNNCYWQREIIRETDKYESDSSCQRSQCIFFDAHIYLKSVRLVIYVPSLNATFLSNEITFKRDQKYKMNLMQNGSAEITTI